LVGGAILIGLGLLFLVGQFLGANLWRLFWPLAIIGVGGLFFVGMIAGGRSSGGLAIPGSILSMIGLLMLYQNLTGHWASWSYGWTLIVFAVGAGILIMGWWTQDESRRRAGLRVMGVGIVLFVIFGSFFELGAMLLGARGAHGAGQLLFPVLLIATGLYLVAVRSGLVGGRKPEPPAVSLPEERNETPGASAG
jgi:hypothetical protein